MARRRHPGMRELPSGRWQARPTIDGEQVPLGTFASIEEARKAIEEARVAARGGTFVDPGQGRITLADYARLWLEGRIGIADGTRRTYQTTIASLGWLGRLQLSEISPATVRKWISELSGSLAPSTVRIRHIHVKTILNAAIAEQRLVRNPAKHPSIELPRGGPVRARRYLTYDEVVAVTGELAKLKHLEDVDFTWTLVWGGFRFNEGAGLDATQVDLRAGRFRLSRQWDPNKRQHRPLKARKDETEVRHTPIAPDLVPILERRAKVGMLFVGPPKLHTYKRHIEKAAEAAKVERFTPHDLRHTCASWLHAVGVPIEEASVWLGHRNSSITAAIYTHLWPRQMDAAAEKLAGIKDVDLGAGVTRLRREA